MVTAATTEPRRLRASAAAVVGALALACAHAAPAPPDGWQSQPAALRGKATYLGVAYAHETTNDRAFATLTAAFGAPASAHAVGAAGAGRLLVAYVMRADAAIDLWRACEGSGWNGRW